MMGHYLFFAILAILTSVYIYKKIPSPDNKFMVYLFIGSLVLRFYLAALFTGIGYIHHKTLFLSGDDLLYSDAATDILNNIVNGTYSYQILYFGMNLYTHILALFYGIFGFKFIASKFINGYLGALIPVAAYFTSRRFPISRGAAKTVAVISALYPSFVFWSTHNLKEPLIILSILLGLNILLKTLSRELTVSDIGLLLLFSFLILNLQVLYLYQIGVIAAAVLFCYSTRPFKIAWSVIIAILLIVIARKGNCFAEIWYLAEMHARNMAVADTAGYYIYPANFMADIKSGHYSFFTFIPIYLKGMAYFLFSPFPWEIKSLHQALILPQLLAWYVLLVLSAIGYIKSFYKNALRDIMVFAFAFIGITLWVFNEGNVGAAFRHRDHFAVIIFIYAAWAIKDILNRFEKSAGRKDGI